MKRVILIGLMMVLSVSLYAGCTGGGSEGNSGAAQSDGAQSGSPSEKELEAGKEYAKDAVDLYGGDMSAEEKEKIKDAIDSINANWPADKLPDGMPVYPEGEFITGADDDAVSISVTGSSLETFSKYLEDLKSDGWDIEEAIYMDDTYIATKGSWQANFMFTQGILIIGVHQEN